MRNLLSAHFMRLRRDRVFWLAMGLMFAIAALGKAGEHIRFPAFRLNVPFFYFMLYIGAFISVFTSMFLGAEYGDGTLRNRLIIGHRRAGVYLANLALSCGASLLFVLAHMAVALAQIPLLWTRTDAAMSYLGNVLPSLLILPFTVIALSSICTLISTLCTRTVVGLVVSAVVFVGLLYFASLTENMLSAPEMISSGITIAADGMIQPQELVPNPRYVTGAMRDVLGILQLILPTGQCLQIAFEEVTQPLLMLAGSVCVTTLTTLVGIVLFDKKDLK